METKSQKRVKIGKKYRYFSKIIKIVCTGVPRNMTVGKCRLPYSVLDMKGCLQFISFKKCFAHVYFTLKLILLWLLYDIFIIIVGIKQLNKLWKKTF